MGELNLQTLISLSSRLHPLNLVNAYLPEKFDISIYGFEALGNDEYSISIDLLLPSQWVKENGGEFSLPDVSSLAPLLKLNEGLVKSVSKVRLLLNHDCDAMVGSVYGDYNACIPKTKTTIKGTLKSKVLSDVTRGKYVKISVDPELNTYDSIAFDFTNLGIGLVKEVAIKKPPAHGNKTPLIRALFLWHSIDSSIWIKLIKYHLVSQAV